METTILIVDDEKDIVEMLADYFTYNGYRVLTAFGGAEALEKAAQNPSLILLDINMPDLDGLEVCERIRGFVSCPILFLTARVEDSDKIQGFGIGGDDYIVKPFSIEELGARVKAHLRREQRTRTSSRIKFENGLTIDYLEKCVYVQGEEVSLARKEFEILALLSRHPGQVFDKERIYERIWGYDSEGNSGVVAEHIRRIRVKLGGAGVRECLETVWGAGYKWKKQSSL